MNLFRRFAKSVSGNFGIMTVGLSIPLLIAAGLSIDYTRHTSAKRHIQDLADSTSLVLAGSKETDKEKLRVMAEKFLATNAAAARLENVVLTMLESDSDRVTVSLKGDIPATFIAIAGFERLRTSGAATAERAVRGNLEIALILDNTYSMSGPNDTGLKMATLKTASAGLVDKLLEIPDGSVRIALVPYAEYVNVGTHNRNASWLSVPADYTTTPAPKTCETKTTKSVCVSKTATYSCTKVEDGVEKPATCGGQCTYETQTVPPYESCTGGGKGTAYQWYGCVGSRMAGDNRLHDKSPSATYPGYVETSQKCPSPIQALTNNRNALNTAISGMVYKVGSYTPYTYIPAGLIWGLNVLSPGHPFAEAQAYDEKNQRPRKVAVLMTDGENTMRFVAGNGTHARVTINAGDSQATRDQKAAQLAATDADTKSICTYMKAQGIEIYSVAFMVTDANAKAMLEFCATSAEHYFDASAPEALESAFSDIGDALRVVRLVN